MVQWKREKNVNDQPNEQPNRASTSREDKRVVDFVDKNPGLTLFQSVERLSRRGIHVSRSTLRRRLIEKDVRYRPVIKKPLLTQKHIEKRMQWATENLTTDWSKVRMNHRFGYRISVPILGLQPETEHWFALLSTRKRSMFTERFVRLVSVD